MMKLKSSLKYFLLTIAIFLIEVLIATKLKDIFFVRAYLGDVIVILLIYTFIKCFFTINNNQKLIFGILIFSCLVEFAQYFNIAEKLGFRRGSLMYIVIGNSFSWIDILCYAAGCLLLFLFVKLQKNNTAMSS
ncbi:DNA integrity scanning protein DisA with diadenylate cyclase activity [Chryseobacterium ginsenosidimutans]|nr:DNA integrity scanning protein DisA with diadenylate cyclase activity [Chryseobacterium ginsenosidimutans]